MTEIITDAQATEILAGLTEPRITPEYMKSRIRHEEFITPDNNPTVTLCMITVDNGFVAIGMSAPAASGNFNADLGRKIARQKAIDDLWGKFGFALAEKIYSSRGSEPLAGIEVPATPPSVDTDQGQGARPPALNLVKNT